MSLFQSVTGTQLTNALYDHLFKDYRKEIRPIDYANPGNSFYCSNYTVIIILYSPHQRYYPIILEADSEGRGFRPDRHSLLLAGDGK